MTSSTSVRMSFVNPFSFEGWSESQTEAKVPRWNEGTLRRSCPGILGGSAWWEGVRQSLEVESEDWHGGREPGSGIEGMNNMALDTIRNHRQK